MKYLVMETFKSYAVLLDEEGRFLKSANPGYQVGETIKNPVIMRSEPLEKVKKPRKLVRLITAMAAIFALVIGINVYQNNYMADSSIHIAINPRIQMDLNKKGEVLEVKGTNLDGESLVSQFEKTSSDKSVVTDELIDIAIELGFLSAGGKVSIGIDASDSDRFKEYGIELRKTLEKRDSIAIEISDLDGMGRSQDKEEEVERDRETELESEKESKPKVEKEKKEEIEKIPESEKKNESKNSKHEKVEKVENPLTEKPIEEKKQYITANQAKAIALKHAGLRESDVKIDQVQQKEEDGILYYDIEFDKDRDEYEYEIHAVSGEILDYDHDLHKEESPNDLDDDDDDDD